MHMAWALLLILALSLSAPIAAAAFLAVSLPAANENKDQHSRLNVLPSDPIPESSLTPRFLPGDTVALQSINADFTLPPPKNHGVNIPFHIPDTPIGLNVTSLGRTLRFKTVWGTFQLALEQISLNVGLHPAQSITDGSFQQRNEGLVFRIHQYAGEEISWSLLNQLLLGLRYCTTQIRWTRELRFEIEVLDNGLVGYGSLRYIGPEVKDVAKRDNISEPALTNSTRSLLLMIPKEMSLVFSYHFFGPTIPEPAISTCFRLARESIRTHVQRHPDENIPNGRFQFRPDQSQLWIIIEAYAGNEIMWHLLGDILRDVSRELVGQRRLLACEFEFEAFPFEESLGHGSLLPVPPVGFRAIPSGTAVSAVKRSSPRLRIRR